MQSIDLIRHGQSTFNEAYAATRIDPMHFDARLTDLGRRQAAETRQLLLGKSYDLVVTSPLTRAIETTLGVFGGRGIPITVQHLHRECLESSCDVGRSPGELLQEFPELAFAHLPSVWWHDAEERGPGGFALETEELIIGRVSEFGRWLSARPERRIAVIGHGTFFFHMTGHMMKNCEVVAWAPAVVA